VIYSSPDGSQLAKVTIPRANTGMILSPRGIINPGSVGQPRDRDPRAAYGLFDPQRNSWDYRRIHYDIADVQRRMRSAGLPDRHIQRLEIGW
jgi:hypothetical protein